MIELDIFTQVAKKLNLDLATDVGGTRLTFSKRDGSSENITVHTNNLDLNSNSASFAAKDKVLCSEILTRSGIKNLNHYLCTADSVTKVLTREPFLPVVTKPIRGSSGTGVNFAFSKEEFLTHLTKCGNNRNISISDYISYGNEYRVIVYKDRILLTYAKQRGDNHQHNLSTGSKPIDVNDDKHGILYKTALQVLSTLELNAASIDFFINLRGTPVVVEVNNNILMYKLAETHFDLAVDVYSELIVEVFNNKYKQEYCCEDFKHILKEI